MTACMTGGAMLGRPGPPKQEVPREGTKIRALFNLLQAARGKVVHFEYADLGYSKNTSLYTAAEYLRSSYGLDIRIPSNSGRNHYGCNWLLAGEWFGKVYVDYVAERNNQS